MRDARENKLSMAMTVQLMLNNHNSIVAQVPAFAEAKTELDASIQEIRDLVGIQITQITNKDKRQAMLKAVEAAMEVIGPAKAFALETNNQGLVASFGFAPSELKKMRDAVLLNTLRLVQEQATAISTQLVPYGMTPGKLTALEISTNAFEAIMTVPRANITARATATKALTPAFQKLDTILQIMDGIVEGKKSSHQEFYGVFKQARKIVDNRGGGGRKEKGDGVSIGGDINR